MAPIHTSIPAPVVTLVPVCFSRLCVSDGPQAGPRLAPLEEAPRRRSQGGGGDPSDPRRDLIRFQCAVLLAYVATYASVDAGIQDYFTRLSAPPALTHAPGASVVCADTHANLVSRWAGGHHPVTIAGHQTNHEDGALMMCVADLIVI